MLRFGLLSLVTRRRIGVPPPAALAGLYGLLIVAGAVALKLPLSRAAPLSWADAFFTATSAVTVTGLLVAVILIVGGLTFFPALALGPIAEQVEMLAGQTF